MSHQLRTALKIAAHWPSIRKEQRWGNDCSVCALSDILPLQLGCNGPSEPDPMGFRTIYNILGMELDRCPTALARDPSCQKVLSLYDAYRIGHLPHGSGLLNETALYCEAMAYCDELRAEIEAKEIEKMETTKPTEGQFIGTV